MSFVINKTLPEYSDDTRTVHLTRPSLLDADRFEKAAPVMTKVLNSALSGVDSEAEVEIPTSELDTLIAYLTSHISKITLKDGSETEDKDQIRDYLEHQGALFLLQKLYSHFLLQIFIKDRDIDVEALAVKQEEKAEESSDN